MAEYLPTAQRFSQNETYVVRNYDGACGPEDRTNTADPSSE
jgi:hypothetical protein